MAQPPSQAQLEAIFNQFIQQKRIVVADVSPGVRSGVAKVFKELGAKTTNMASASSFATAVEEINRLRPQVIVADYRFGDDSGLKLLEMQKEHFARPSDRMFIVLTSTAAESAVAEASEEEIDSFVLKPFTLDFFKTYIVQSTLPKIKPSPYDSMIIAGREKLKAKALAEAIACFANAIKLDPKPTLALYYRGHAHALNQDLVSAEADYRAGLAINDLHYRCLSGLCDVLNDQKNYAGAFEVARIIAQKFPLSPQRLETILRLAIKNQTFEEIDFLYGIFQKIDFRTAELIKCMKSALVVAGIYHLKRLRIGQAVESFQRAVTASNRAVPVISEVMGALIKHGYANEAEEFLKCFDSSQWKSREYRVLQLRCIHASGPAVQVIEKARALINDDIHDPLVYDVLIRRSRECKFVDAAETLVYEAAARWPDRKQEFMDLLALPAGTALPKSTS